LEREEIIESPGNRTAGLTSAIQIVDVTDSASFSAANTTCALPEHLPPMWLPEKLETKVPEVFPQLLSRTERFKRALEESMKKNKAIIKELAKY
jgi:hypothetical protein